MGNNRSENIVHVHENAVTNGEYTFDNANGENEKNRKNGTNGKKWIALFITMILVCTFVITTVMAMSGEKLQDDAIDEAIDLYQTDFGKQYKDELSEMKRVRLMISRDGNAAGKTLVISSGSSVKDNIILFHMISTHLDQIVDDASEITRIRGYDTNFHSDEASEDQSFTGRSEKVFDYSMETKDFAGAFVGREYMEIVEENERKLYAGR